MGVGSSVAQYLSSSCELNTCSSASTSLISVESTGLGDATALPACESISYDALPTCRGLSV